MHQRPCLQSSSAGLLLVLLLGSCAHRSDRRAVAEGEILAGYLDLHGARAWYLRGRTAELRGDLVEAERSLKWVVRLDRRTPWGPLRVGAFHARQGEVTEAEASFQLALSRSGPEDAPAAHAALGRLLLATDEPRARRHLEAACPGPACAEAADAAHAAGDREAALSVLERWRLADVSEEASRERALRAERLEAWTLAVEDWLTVLESAPDAEVVEHARDVAARAGDDRVEAWLRTRGGAP